MWTQIFSPPLTRMTADYPLSRLQRLPAEAVPLQGEAVAAALALLRQNYEYVGR